MFYAQICASKFLIIDLFNYFQISKVDMHIDTFCKTGSLSRYDKRLVFLIYIYEPQLLSMGWFIDIHSRLSIWLAKCYRCGCFILTSTNCKIYSNAFYVLRIYGIQITWYINIFHHIKPFLTLCSLWYWSGSYIPSF